MDNKEKIISKMKQIRIELDEIAITRADLYHEYMALNQELGRIEFQEIQAILERAKS